jgi:hypothetical protein
MMKNWEIIYVKYIFKDKNDKEQEKIKNCKVEGNDIAEAERIFLNKNLKFKKIISIVEDNSNSIGNICPELLKIRNQLKNK